MSKTKDITELNEHKEQTVSVIENFIDELINASSEEDISSRKKADLICYWLKDYINFLNSERDFEPKKLKRYKRGEIVKVHLGFRIGSEEGGLHYAVVLDTNNSLSSPTLTVVPLTSVKKGKDLENLPKGNVYLGNELYNLLQNKIGTLIKTAQKEVDDVMKELGSFERYLQSDITDDDFILKKQNEIDRTLALLKKSKKEVEKMKRGSIALTNQIVTVSKLRIYDPKTPRGVLSGIRLSNVNLNKIDKEIMCNYTKSNKT
ncbi:MAG: type II toxin-antitoxin system PemK/MazF family toxin [Prevotella sp.]|nr:type II toxin-antitoxin system PemK/MazF family toxin [Prevotella sp.]